MIRAATVLLLAATGLVGPQPRYFRYERSLDPTKTGQTCAALPAEVFAHASPGLTDLRLFHEGTEIPFVLQTPTPTQAHPETLPSRNLGVQEGRTVFDAAMPSGTYRDVELDLDARNFIATITVWGSRGEADAKPTRLGNFTVFDLTEQRLGRSTVLHLPESDFRTLHFVIAGPLHPAEVQGIHLPAQGAGEAPYTPAATTSSVRQENRSSVAQFDLPAHVPADRIVFVPESQPAMFNRDVSVTVRPLRDSTPVTDESVPPTPPVSFTGNLLRLHRRQDGQEIDEERVSLDLNNQTFVTPTHWTVRVENGDDPPISLHSVRLEFEQHSLCFEAAAGAHYSLFYGDPALAAPQYDYARLFAQQPDVALLSLGREQSNPDFTPRPDSRPFTERHPTLLWIALLVTVGLLGILASRSRPPSTSAS